MSKSLSIVNGRVLVGGGLTETAVMVGDGRITGLGAGTAAERTLDATGLLVLPGIVDLHGDAFERELQPRPGVNFAAPLALRDTEAQLLANGITTALHAITLSWEPGLRSAAAWRRVVDAIEALRPDMLCDM